MKTKMTKRKMDSIKYLVPSKLDAVQGDFDYVQYIEDVVAFRKGILQGYMTDMAGVRIQYYEDDKDDFLDNKDPYISPDTEEYISRIGDLDIHVYEKKAKELHNEFVLRVLAGEDLDIVNASISAKIEKLATQNNDGTYNLKLDNLKKEKGKKF